MGRHRLQDRLRGQAFVDEQRKRGNAELAPLGLAGPVEERPRHALQLGGGGRGLGDIGRRLDARNEGLTTLAIRIDVP